MQQHTSSAHAPRAPRPIVIAALVLTAAVAGLAGCGSLASSASPSSARTSSESSGSDRPDADVPLDAPGRLHGTRRDAVSAADGWVADFVTVSDDASPAIANLDPDLLSAVRAASAAARDQGADLHVSSGWRSERYQRQLFEEAVAKYGSAAEAARWVARPGTSVHEAGGAVDIGPDRAATWLADFGAGFGLCQIYRNEPWHFELRPDAREHGCPAMYADPADDPRMQR